MLPFSDQSLFKRYAQILYLSPQKKNMIKSMTGYGKATGVVNESQVTIEIKSLNSKFIELGLRLVDFRDKEAEIRNWLVREIERGKAEMNIQVENNAEKRRSYLNKTLIHDYYKELLVLKKEFGLESTDYLKMILSMPNVLSNDRVETDEKTWKQLEDLIKKAVKAFNEFRTAEGKTLAADFTDRLKAIQSWLEKIEKHEPGRIKALRTKLKRGLAGLEEITIDKNRFEQELIFYIEKLDITEEKVRLRSHIHYFSETLKAKDSNGKKLGFIIQEIGREINTIGSKANDAYIQKFVVEMKDELEKMKEQSSNVL